LAFPGVRTRAINKSKGHAKNPTQNPAQAEVQGKGKQMKLLWVKL